ncbi:hypothetical protein HHI36_001853 [Cryptolaemus montrouzieri]|uniref:RNA transcription, translation and transport factor protein n=1 Tax=Cryptolaemus montrouzieri TaxID=559131 RepID=A0ABD2P956_9CUCU
MTSKRLLNALEYPEVDSFNIKDDTSFRKIVVWLEKNKIKRAPYPLEPINSPEWRKTYEKYKKFLGCPENITNDEESLQWLAGYAVQEEYSKKKDVLKKHVAEETATKNIPDIKTENPLDTLDFYGNDFTDGINKVAKLLNITPHPNPTITLKAVKHIVTNRLTQHALKNPDKYITKGTPFPLQDADLGFDLSDPVLKQAAKILRMLYIQDLRHLQTKANELIVAVQNITANPKTDTRLGKVGF